MKERNEEIKEGSNDGGGIVNQEERERKREKKHNEKEKSKEEKKRRGKRGDSTIPQKWSTNHEWLPQQKGPKFGRIFMKYGARKSSI